MAGFSEVFVSQRARLERLAAIAEPLRKLPEIMRDAERGEVLKAEDVASLFAAARDQASRAAMQAAADRIRI